MNNKIEFDLILKNGMVINVFTEEIIKTDIGIKNGIIIRTGNLDGKNIINCEGRYLSPGLIDAHLHIESSMIAPKQFADFISLRGTTTIIADPHEIVNVSGENGLNYMLEETEDCSCNVFFNLPSCVPATKFENNGCNFSSEKMKKFIHNKRILGLGEVMDYVSVITNEEEMMKKINLFSNKIIDGHAPRITGDDLQSYRLNGIITDHECETYQEALEKLRMGFYILIREGTAAHNLKELLKPILEDKIPLEQLCFCTDDKHIDDIDKNDHIIHNVRMAIQLGLNPIKSIKLASINTARLYNLKKLGAVSVGYQADILVLDNLEELNIQFVLHKGKVIIENNIPKKNKDIINSINIKNIDDYDIKLKLSETETTVIKLVENQLTTKKELSKVILKNNIFIPDNIHQKVIVIERHNKTGNIGIGIIKNFGLEKGAIASSVSHDSHNIIIVGTNDDDIIMALKEIKLMGGGYAVSHNKKIICKQQLELSGLMTDTDRRTLSKNLNNMIDICHNMGVKKCFDPFITLSFLALPVIPEIRITDTGLFDVTNFKFI
ncbi:MAG: adenine deaminase [Oscillospiraceae bacterium]|nr:adenine deaminase [Oscillospiraceae bacterium]